METFNSKTINNIKTNIEKIFNEKYWEENNVKGKKKLTAKRQSTLAQKTRNP
jgi:hypothetical protein